MSEHKITLTWKRGDAPFEYQKYPRNHTWKFDGGHEMTASAAPAYLGNPKNTDPEEAFVASLSSCHMLTFLAIACKQKFVLDEYVDEAVGHMEKNADGKMAITRVELQREFAALKGRLGKGMVFVTHDVREGLLLGTRIGLMLQGRLAFLGTPDEFRGSDNPECRAFMAAA